MAGYSGTPLWKKLGIRPGSRLGLFDAPDGFVIEDLPDDVTPDTTPQSGPYDVILQFATELTTLRSTLATHRPRMDDACGLWFAWPKKASGMATELTENILRREILPTGLVDNKVCAVDATWSGLRFVIRVRDRNKKRRT